MSDEAVRVADWDGSRPTTCGATGCLAAPAIHFEASILGCEFVAEFDVCAEHLSFASEQARAFLVAMGVVEPADTTERNIRTAAEEHVAGVQKRTLQPPFTFCDPIPALLLARDGGDVVKLILEYDLPAANRTMLVVVIDPATGAYRVAPFADEIFADLSTLGAGVAALHEEIAQ